MDQKKYEIMRDRPGYISALDFGGLGPNTLYVLKNYGVNTDEVDSDEKADLLANRYRERMICNDAYNADKICGCIIMNGGLEYKINGKCTSEYLWEDKNILTFLAVSNNPLPAENGVRLMHPIYDLEGLLDAAEKHGVFGTKAYTDILDYDEKGMRELMDQQVFIGKQAVRHGLVPIMEPCVAINNPRKAECEEYLHGLLKEAIEKFSPDEKIMFKLTLPEQDDLYADIMEDERVVRVVGLSGGYSQKEACERLSRNHGMAASFARAFMEGLKIYFTDEEFDRKLSENINNIFEASIT